MTDCDVRFMVRVNSVGLHLLPYLYNLSVLIVVHAHTRVHFLISPLFLAFASVGERTHCHIFGYF